eukprot:TRINITY_DN18419_c0_g1_i1.p1 TRINITY_DN18419_c0_g1~~TRINITY_DN18419_c0_g1_i1.p1  ORF type:complete len:934 (-),score=103.85 TRINITY_DN18419_c0_g1_i1:91-2892(-)
MMRFITLLLCVVPCLGFDSLSVTLDKASSNEKVKDGTIKLNIEFTLTLTEDQTFEVPRWRHLDISLPHQRFQIQEIDALKFVSPQLVPEPLEYAAGKMFWDKASQQLRVSGPLKLVRGPATVTFTLSSVRSSSSCYPPGNYKVCVEALPDTCVEAHPSEGERILPKLQELIKCNPPPTVNMNDPAEITTTEETQVSVWDPNLPNTLSIVVDKMPFSVLWKLQATATHGTFKLTSDNKVTVEGEGTSSFMASSDVTSSTLPAAMVTLQYTPNVDFAGTDTINWKLTTKASTDGAKPAAKVPGRQETTTGTIAVTVEGVDDGPKLTDPIKSVTTKWTATTDLKWAIKNPDDPTDKTGVVNVGIDILEGTIELPGFWTAGLTCVGAGAEITVTPVTCDEFTIGNWCTTGSLGSINGKCSGTAGPNGYTCNEDSISVGFISDGTRDQQVLTELKKDHATLPITLDDLATTTLSDYHVLYLAASADQAKAIEDDTYTALADWVSSGGRLFVTGYNVISSARMARLVGSQRGASVARSGRAANPDTKPTSPAWKQRTPFEPTPLSDGRVRNCLQEVTNVGSNAFVALQGPLEHDTRSIVAGLVDGEHAWTLRMHGDGLIAYVANGAQSGVAVVNPWTGVYSAALRNFAVFASDSKYADSKRYNVHQTLTGTLDAVEEVLAAAIYYPPRVICNKLVKDMVTVTATNDANGLSNSYDMTAFVTPDGFTESCNTRNDEMYVTFTPKVVNVDETVTYTLTGQISQHWTDSVGVALSRHKDCWKKDFISSATSRYYSAALKGPSSGGRYWICYNTRANNLTPYWTLASGYVTVRDKPDDNLAWKGYSSCAGLMDADDDVCGCSFKTQGSTSTEKVWLDTTTPNGRLVFSDASTQLLEQGCCATTSHRHTFVNEGDEWGYCKCEGQKECRGSSGNRNSCASWQQF